MLDKEGYRPNVGIILANQRNEVFWGKRVNQHAWQFPQGGIKPGETPLQAMFRELEEEIGLAARATCASSAARATGCATRCRSSGCAAPTEAGCAYRGQKQIWYLLRMVGRDCDVKLRASGHPEFDAWRWHDYWVPLEAVIEFKREVYRQALIELHRYLPVRPPRARARGPRRSSKARAHGAANTTALPIRELGAGAGFRRPTQAQAGARHARVARARK